MKQLRSSLGMVALAVICTNQAYALEGATTGSQATQATVGVLDSKITLTNSYVTSIIKCNASRKFYAPADPNRDANNCVGIQDYTLTMNSTNGVATSNGMLLGQQTGANWAVEGVGSGSGYGVYGQSPNVALYAANSGNTNWTAEVQAGASPYGLVIDNNSHNAYLCLNGSCVTSLNASGHNGGAFSLWNGQCGAQGSTAFYNPLTGGCSCPTGYSAAPVSSIFDVTHNNWTMYICYQ